MAREHQTGLVVPSAEHRIVRPKVLASYIRISRAPLGLPDVLHHPAAPEMFQLVRATSVRTGRELAGIQVAVGEGKFDNNGYQATREQVVREVRRDPVYTLADTYLRETEGEGLELLTAEQTATQSVESDDVFVFDGVPYGGYQGRVLRLLTSATDYPLSIRSLAPLVYPTELDFSSAVQKAESVVGGIRQGTIKKHERFYLGGNQRGNHKEYFIASKGQAVPDATVIGEPHPDQQEASNPKVTIDIHTEGDYIIVNGKLIRFYSTNKISRAAEDGVKVLDLLVGRDWVAAAELINLFRSDSPRATSGYLSKRLGLAREWLDQHVTIDDKPVLTISTKKGSGANYGIIGVDVEINRTSKPLDQQEITTDSSLVDSAQMEMLLEGIDKPSSQFTFPDGTVLSGRPALLSYLLLHISPRWAVIDDLQKVVYGEASKSNRSALHRVKERVAEVINNNFPKARLERHFQDRQVRLSVQGYEGAINLDEAFSVRKKEPTVASSARRHGTEISDTSLSIASDDPQAHEAFVTALPIILDLRRNSRVTWGNYSSDQKRALIYVIANELGKPASMVESPDFHESFELFGNSTLTRFFVDIYKNSSKREGVRQLDEYLINLGIVPTVEDIIAHKLNDREISWGRVPWEVRKELFRLCTAEDGLPDYALGWSQFKSPRKFLNGRTLGGFTVRLLREPDILEGENRMVYLRRKLGLPEMPKDAYAYLRLEFLRQVTQELEIDFSATPTNDQLLPLVGRITELYQSLFFRLDRKEFLAEVYIALSDAINNGNGDQEELLRNIHRHLETSAKESLNERYKLLFKKGSARAPLGLSAVDLDKKLPSQTSDYTLPQVSAQSGNSLTETTQQNLDRLSSLDQFLVLAIAVDGWDLDTIAVEVKNEFKVDMDVDMLQEHYEDAIARLRTEMENGDN